MNHAQHCVDNVLITEAYLMGISRVQERDSGVGTLTNALSHVIPTLKATPSTEFSPSRRTIKPRKQKVIQTFPPIHSVNNNNKVF